MAAVYTALYAWRFNCTMWFNLVYGTKCTLTTSSSGADTLPCTIPQDRGQSKEKCTTVVSEDV